MLSATIRKLAKCLTTTSRRPARASTRQTALAVEGLEDRMVLSTAMQTGSTLLVIADPGRNLGSIGKAPSVAVIGSPINQPRPITFQADRGLLDVLDSGTLLGKFPISSIKSVNVSVAGLDAINVDDSNGFPFAAGTTISLFGSGSNSLNLTGSRTITGGEAYAAGSGSRAGSLSLGGATFQFSGVIDSVTDTVKTTAPLVVSSSGQSLGVTLSGQNGVTQQLTGLAGSGGGGGTLTFSNKPLVTLELSGSGNYATLNATAAATGEKSFVVDLIGQNQALNINATPSGVDTTGNVPGQTVELNANSGRVILDGNSSTLVNLGELHNQTTAGIQADVFINGAESVFVDDNNNFTTQEHVTVTESTISGTGLFGNNAVVVHYSGLASGFLDGLTIATGQMANTYSVVGSHPGAAFGPARINIDDVLSSQGKGLNVLVAVDSGSGLNLGVKFWGNPAYASLFISAVNGTVNPSAPTFESGTETMTFAGGLTSTVLYDGFDSVTHS
jgi:hypothetical protein